MKSLTAVLIVTWSFALSFTARATTCVANEKFKVKQLCGKVLDPGDVPIPDVGVDLLDANGRMVQQSRTDQDGVFSIQGIQKGEYVIEVRFPGFARAWQPLTVTSSKPRQCKGAIEVSVRLAAAGHCSAVAKAK